MLKKIIPPIKNIIIILLSAILTSVLSYMFLSMNPMDSGIIIYYSIILFLCLSSISIFFYLKHNRIIKNFKIPLYEYTLSERTASYLIKIMNHKLNTPLKVISTKSRILIENIVKSDMVDKLKEKSEWDYVQIDQSLKSIFNVISKMKNYNELSQNEVNLYKLFNISKETIDILNDVDFDIEIDYKSKLFEINKSVISSHEIIQLFINQIKFSLSLLADKISITIFYHNNKSITILYSDNGNFIDSYELALLNNTELDLSNLINHNILDIILNFNMLNNTTSKSTNIRLLSSNKNGNIFEIKLPIYKIKINKQKL